MKINIPLGTYAACRISELWEKHGEWGGAMLCQPTRIGRGGEYRLRVSVFSPEEAIRINALLDKIKADREAAK